MATFGNVNIAKNEITGKFIKSDPPTQKYLDNYDKAFAKKTPLEWATDLKLEASFDEEEKISYKEFLKLLESVE